MTLSTLLYFLGASVALTLAPGPDNTFIVAQGISRGRKAPNTSRGSLPESSHPLECAWHWPNAD